MNLNFFSKRMGIIVISILVIAAIAVIFIVYGSRIKMFITAKHNSCAGLGGERPTSAMGIYLCENENKTELVWVTDPEGTSKDYIKDGAYACCVQWDGVS